MSRQLVLVWQKYEVDRTSHSDGRQPDNDIVLFRYADALLMKSEAKVRNGDGVGGERGTKSRGYLKTRNRGFRRENGKEGLWGGGGGGGRKKGGGFLEFITNHTISESNWLMRKMGIPQFFLFHKKV